MCKKINIPYDANIGRTGRAILSALLSHNLLENTLEIDYNNIYRTTEKDMRFIECREEIHSLSGSQ